MHISPPVQHSKWSESWQHSTPGAQDDDVQVSVASTSKPHGSPSRQRQPTFGMHISPPVQHSKWSESWQHSTPGAQDDDVQVSFASTSKPHGSPSRQRQPTFGMQLSPPVQHSKWSESWQHSTPGAQDD